MRYRRKALEVDAVQVTRDSADRLAALPGVELLVTRRDALGEVIVAWMADLPFIDIHAAFVNTALGQVRAAPLDWVIREPGGTLTVVKLGAFELLYEPAD